MENDWERLEPNVLPEAEEVRTHIEEALPGSVVERFERIEEGHANGNLRVDLRDGTRVLLRYHLRDRGAGRREAALSRLVAGRVPAPTYLHVAKDGSWSVQEWVDGITMARALDRGLLPDGASVGKVLAGIGSFRFDRIGFLADDLTVRQPLADGASAYTSHIRHLLALPTVRSRLGEDTARSCEVWLARDEASIEDAGTEARLVHADFKPTNLMLRDDRLAGVLDWEFAHAGLPLLDVAILMRDPRLSDSPFAERFATAFAEEGGQLPRGWLRTANLLDLVNMCQFLERPNAGPNLIRTCVDVVERYLAKWAKSL